jgi:hypothetical protein
MPASAPSPTEWLPYMDGSAAMLAVFLVALAGTCAYIGMKIRNPISVSRPGRVVSGFLIAIWALAIYTFFVALYVYALQLRQVYPHFTRPPKVRVGTLVDAAATFFIILYLTRRYGWKIAVGSAFAGTAAAPMLFELPFDLIVMPMTYPAIPPAPTLYRELFFLPLFIVELSTISLLALLPSMRITGKVLYALAAMLAVFAVWAAFGFSFPAARLPWTLNVISKLLCFVTAILLFVWREAPSDLSRHEAA